MVVEWINSTNITGLDKGRYAASLGDAHQYLVIGILMRLGFQVAHVTDRGLPYDIVIRAFKKKGGETVLIRCQVRTLRKGRISFIAGTRAGVDREYKSGVKQYKFTTEHNDLLIGVDSETLDLYLIPTRFTEEWGREKAVSKLKPLKNNWDILLNWNDEFLRKLQKQLPP